MKKSNMFLIAMILLLIFMANAVAQTPPKPDTKIPPKLPTFTGSVVSMQESTLTVSGGKNGQTEFNTETATWQGYSSQSEVKAGDSVVVTYQGTKNGLNKAISVAKKSNVSSGAGQTPGTSTPHR